MKTPELLGDVVLLILEESLEVFISMSILNEELKTMKNKKKNWGSPICTLCVCVYGFLNGVGFE